MPNIQKPKVMAYVCNASTGVALDAQTYFQERNTHPPKVKINKFVRKNISKFITMSIQF